MSKIVSYNQSLLTSTQDSTESIATPQEADLDDEQIRALLALPRYLLEREASAERSQVYHSDREGLMSSSSQGPELHRHRRTCGMALTSEKVESRRVWPREREREQLVDVLGSNESNFRNFYTANVAKSLLDGKRSLASSSKIRIDEAGAKGGINELQQQASAQRLELEDTLHGYVESRREQVRLQEELAIRDTQIGLYRS